MPLTSKNRQSSLPATYSSAISKMLKSKQVHEILYIQNENNNKKKTEKQTIMVGLSDRRDSHQTRLYGDI